MTTGGSSVGASVAGSLGCSVDGSPSAVSASCTAPFSGAGVLSVDASAVTAEMPKFLASLMLNLNAGYPMPIPQTAVSAETESSKNTDDGDNVDYSAIDFGFIGG